MNGSNAKNAKTGTITSRMHKVPMQRMIPHRIPGIYKHVQIRQRRRQCPDQKRPPKPGPPPCNNLPNRSPQKNMRHRIHGRQYRSDAMLTTR